MPGKVVWVAGVRYCFPDGWSDGWLYQKLLTDPAAAWLWFPDLDAPEVADWKG